MTPDPGEKNGAPKDKKISVGQVWTKNLLSVSRIPGVDFTVNPYVGCPHKCIYCYAEFIKQHTDHTEDWGDFVDVKRCHARLPYKKIQGKTVVMCSSTDGYNPLELRFEATREILKDMVFSQCDFDLMILTKGYAVVRDIDLLLKLKAKVGISINSLDDSFRAKAEPRASSVGKRLEALRLLREAGLETWVFMSPIFPGISDFRTVIDATRPWTCEYGFENLKLKGPYRPRVLEMIGREYPDLVSLYRRIFMERDYRYWDNLSWEIRSHCRKLGLRFGVYF